MSPCQLGTIIMQQVMKFNELTDVVKNAPVCLELMLR